MAAVSGINKDGAGVGAKIMTHNRFLERAVDAERLGPASRVKGVQNLVLLSPAFTKSYRLHWQVRR